MGLAEKRIAAAMEKDSFPAWKNKVLAGCNGLSVEFDVDWENLVNERALESYPANVENNFFNPLAAAIKEIAADDLGAKALKGKIKKVKITRNRDFSALKVSVEDDTLLLDADPTYNKTTDDCSAYADDIRKALEAAL